MCSRTFDRLSNQTPGFSSSVGVRLQNGRGEKHARRRIWIWSLIFQSNLSTNCQRSWKKGICLFQPRSSSKTSWKIEQISRLMPFTCTVGSKPICIRYVMGNDRMWKWEIFFISHNATLPVFLNTGSVCFSQDVRTKSLCVGLVNVEGTGRN